MEVIVDPADAIVDTLANIAECSKGGFLAHSIAAHLRLARLCKLQSVLELSVGVIKAGVERNN